MSRSSFLCGAPSLFDAEDQAVIPFDSAEAAWFWCVRVSDAIHAGARSGGFINSDWGSRFRPCEAVDIQSVVLRLSRNRILDRNHVRVLGFYGKRRLRPPSSSRNACRLWFEAMDRLTPVLQQKGIIRS